ncbi:MAG TPA: hypothetical protein VLC47_05020 [Burkholderiales bacterium]|nr:hypothetical protein [Burkholderiales bacterium]
MSARGELDALRALGVRNAFFVDDNLIGHKAAKDPLRYLVDYQAAHGRCVRRTPGRVCEGGAVAGGRPEAHGDQRLLDGHTSAPCYRSDPGHRQGDDT